MGACCLLDQSKPVCSDAARQWAPWLRGGTWEVARSFHLFLAFLLTSYWLPFCFFYVIISSLFLLSPFCVAFVLYNRGLKARIWFGLWSLICIELLILVGWLWFVFIFIFYFLRSLLKAGAVCFWNLAVRSIRRKIVKTVKRILNRETLQYIKTSDWLLNKKKNVEIVLSLVLIIIVKRSRFIRVFIFQNSRLLVVQFFVFFKSMYDA